MRETIRRLIRSERHQVTILVKTKDVLEALIQADGFPYTNILPTQRGGIQAGCRPELYQSTAVIDPNHRTN